MTLQDLRLNANLTVRGGEDHDQVVLKGYVATVGHNLDINAERITVEDNTVISTRAIADGANALSDDSVGNSGDILFQATATPSSASALTTGKALIDVGSAQLLAHAQGYVATVSPSGDAIVTPARAGRIELKATNEPGFSGFAAAIVVFERQRERVRRFARFLLQRQ